MDMNFQFLWINAKKKIIAGCYGEGMFCFVSLLETVQVVSKWLYHFPFTSAVNEGSVVPHPDWNLGLTSVLDFDSSSRHMIISHFNLHFPDDM